jgi:uncharacterized repeat protein (TIGR03833 family)
VIKRTNCHAGNRKKDTLQNCKGIWDKKAVSRAVQAAWYGYNRTYRSLIAFMIARLQPARKPMTLPKRCEIHPGQRVLVAERPTRQSDTLAEGVVLRILTRAESHPQGIQVQLIDGRVGRVQMVLELTHRRAHPN